jgi:DNA-binding response OmpR family regulator
MRVLLIEHYQLMVRPLKQGLEEEGFIVTVFANGTDEAPLALAARSDVMILDLPFQEEDGLSLLQCWRHQGLDTPVLLLTADSEDEFMHTEKGKVDCLSKPFRLEELFSRLRRLAQQND